MTSFKERHPDFKAPPPWKLRPEVLLCANTVKPMHGVVPRVILGKEWWDRTRRAAYLSTHFHCIACGVHKSKAREHQWLEGHELYEVDYPRGRQTYVETVPLCHYCHSYIHDGRLQMLLAEGSVSQEKFDTVMEHGDEVLKAAKLRSKPYRGEIAAWEDWRLVLDGKEYPPLYPTYADWREAFTIQGSEE